MIMKYRIVQQYGYFYIEKEVEIRSEKHNFWTLTFPGFFKPKITLKKSWWRVTVKGNRSCFLMKEAEFKSLKEAKECIRNFEPKYHNV